MPSLDGPGARAEYEVQLLRDVRIPTADSAATLSADVYLPVSDEPLPALVMALPYRKDAGAGVWYEASLSWFAKHGYACLLVDLRGTGSSDGPMRPAFDPGEGDDAVAAIEWAAAQAWCDGQVGMWGESFSAAVTLRTATLAPAPLKAILSIVGMTDPGRDWAHPNGALGGHSFARFGLMNLMMQLLPPLADFHSATEQERWLARLEDGEPYIVDLFRHGPGDPVWRERAIDAARISLPTLCVTGWRDSLCDSTVRAYESIRGPKRLIVGPWQHTMPHASPFDAIDFLSLALRWWDQWLRGVDTGILEEPPVALFVQGEKRGWRAYDTWPPGRDAGLELAADADGLLTSRGDGDGVGGASGELGRYDPDPRLGTLSGLWGISTGGNGLPMDQHDDDSRSFSVTGEPLERDLLLVGRPRVAVGVTDDQSPPARLVARLADVDEHGRSMFITGGTVTPTEAATRHDVDLWPTAYRVPAGHRLRVVISDAAFPRLWPLADATPIGISAVELVAPTASEDDGVATGFDPPPATGPVMGATFEGDSRITHDLLHDGIDVLLAYKSTAYTLGHEHVLENESAIRAAVRKDAPRAAKLHITENATARLASGERIVVTTAAQVTSETLWVKGEVEVDGMLMYSRVWRDRRTS